MTPEERDAYEDIIQARTDLAALESGEREAWLEGWDACVEVVEHLAKLSGGLVFVEPLLHSLRETRRLVSQ